MSKTIVTHILEMSYTYFGLFSKVDDTNYVLSRLVKSFTKEKEYVEVSMNQNFFFLER